MKYIFLFATAFFAAFSPIFSQKPPVAPVKKDSSAGGWARIEIENGDTIYVAMLRGVTVQDRRVFATAEDQRRYYYYKRCAAKVYPYAVEAVKLYTDIKEETADMSRRKRRKYVKQSQGDLKDEYEGQLKDLTKIQGLVLIKMIERYTGEPFFDIIKQTRGGFTAMYWNGLGKIWGYHLKDGYEVGQDAVLDAVLQDFDLSMSLGNE